LNKNDTKYQTKDVIKIKQSTKLTKIKQEMAISQRGYDTKNPT